MKKSICFLFWIILTTLCLTAETRPNSKGEPMDPGFEQQPVYWYEREVRKRAWMALNEVAVFPKKGEGAKLNRDLFIKQLHPKAAITKTIPLTVISFCVAFGLAVDDTVHLLARYREERIRNQFEEYALNDSRSEETSSSSASSSNRAMTTGCRV